MTLKQKVSVSASIMIGILIIGFSILYWKQLKLEEYNQLMLSCADLQTYNMKMKTDEIQFFIYKNEKDLKKFEENRLKFESDRKSVKMLLEDLGIIVHLTGPRPDQKVMVEFYGRELTKEELISNEIKYNDDILINDIDIIYKKHIDNFNACREKLEKIGLTEDKGLQAELRKSIHEVENTFKKLDREDLQIVLLNLRRAEKDFFLRKEDKYTQRFNDLIVNLQSKVNLIEKDKEAILAQIDNYQKCFTQITTAMRELGFTRTQGLSKDLNITSDLLEPYADILIREVQVLIEKEKQMSNIISIGLALLIVVIVVIALTNLANSIRKQLNADPGDFVKVARVISSGDLTQKFSEFDNVKTGPLRDFINMNNELRNIVIKLKEISVQLSGGSQTIETNVSSLTNLNSEVANKIESINKKADQTANNMTSVAAATEEMCVTIAEISRNMANVQNSAANSNVACNDAQLIITKLANFSKEANGISKIIASIAGQSNLLALNATIEAARAGEMGKGFAVVANEVKELAKQTSESIERVDQTLKSIQDGSDSANNAIQLIFKNFNLVTDMTTTVSSAIEEQNATTSEISKQGAVVGSDMLEIATMVKSIEQISNEANQKAKQLSNVASTLNDVANRLSSQLSHFKV